MNARLYAKTAKTPKATLKGQAAIVYAAIGTTPELATAINERVDVEALKTRQDPFRVTLYYILVFKKQGLVAAFEPAVEVEAEAVEQPENVDEVSEAGELTEAE